MISCAILQKILLLQVLSVVAGEYCQYDYKYFYSSYYTRYCSNGCCGNKYSDYSDVCCPSLNGGQIAGIVFGCLAVLGITISLIACCCSAANNSSRRTGVVVQPANTGMQTLVVNSTAFSQAQSTFPCQQGAVGYGYPFGVQPPPYAQLNNMPQGSSNQAFVPPPTAKY